MIINGVEDHVHCLLALKPTITISELMKTVKAKSSKYINGQSINKIKIFMAGRLWSIFI
jgi:REP element-mobilizing transposase RayT